MTLGTRCEQRHTPMWVGREKVAPGPGSPFYHQLNAILAEAGFDRFVQAMCARFDAQRSRQLVAGSIHRATRSVHGEP